MEKIEYPKIYGNYVTLGISQPTDAWLLLEKKSEVYTAFSTENNWWMNIYLYKNEIYHNALDEPFQLVLYKKLGLGDDAVYAKPVDMFLNEIEVS